MIADRESRVRQRAHEIWQAEGCPEGRAEEHWARAEREVDAEQTPSPAEKAPAAKPKAAATKGKAEKTAAEKKPAAKSPAKTAGAAAAKPKRAPKAKTAPV